MSWRLLPDPSTLSVLSPVAEAVDSGLSRFTVANGAALESLKNTAMFYVLLPLRIGLDNAVLPFTWGFQWTAQMSAIWFAAAIALGGALIVSGRVIGGLLVVVFAGVIETGIAQLPWPFVLTGATMLGWVAGGRKLAVLTLFLLSTILVSGLWERALLSLYLSGASVFACAVVGGATGL